MSSDTNRAAREQITEEIVRVQEKAYGAGASSAQTTIDGDLVVVLIDVDLARSERTLLDAGHGDAVKRVRESFQKAIQPTFGAIVERATGRRVCSFMSMMSTDPVYQVEVFRLAAPNPAYPCVSSRG